MTDQDTTAAADSARVTKATRDAERHEATLPADAGPEPTADEARAADSNRLDPEVARANKEAVERGAEAKGEGRIA
jgi:hypothetical protein